jgi:hypothetical protein
VKLCRIEVSHIWWSWIGLEWNLWEKPVSKEKVAFPQVPEQIARRNCFIAFCFVIPFWVHNYKNFIYSKHVKFRSTKLGHGFPFKFLILLYLKETAKLINVPFSGWLLGYSKLSAIVRYLEICEVIFKITFFKKVTEMKLSSSFITETFFVRF